MAVVGIYMLRDVILNYRKRKENNAEMSEKDAKFNYGFDVVVLLFAIALMLLVAFFPHSLTKTMSEAFVGFL